MIPTLYGLAVLAAVLAWVVARHRPEHRPIALLLGYGLASDVVRRATRLSVLQPARAELGGAPFTGWVRVASHVESALFVGWMAGKRLTAAELLGQVRLVRAPIARGLRGTQATREDVKDLSQDVLLAAWEASEEGRYRPDPDMEPARALAVWMRTLAYHRVRHRRESARVRREEPCAEPPHAEHEAPTPEQPLEHEEMRRAFLDALHQLPEHEGDVIISHDVFETSMEDVAEQQDAPVSTAYKWRSRRIA